MGGEHNCNGGCSTYIVFYTVHVVIDAFDKKKKCCRNVIYYVIIIIIYI